MAQIYVGAESVEAFAIKLIPTYHPELATARIKYYFREKAGKKGGRPVYGTVKKVSDLMKYLVADGRGEDHEYDFLVEVAMDTWNDLTAPQRNALVDHLLERCYGEENDEDGGAMKWVVREPDVHEFTTILRRHGIWNESLNGFVEVAQLLNASEESDSVDAAEHVTTHS